MRWGAATPFVMFLTRFNSVATPRSASDPVICASASSFRRASSGLSRPALAVHDGADGPHVEAPLLEQIGQPFRHERVQRRGGVLIPIEGFAGTRQQRLQSHPDLESGQLTQIGEDLHRSLRLPAQPERVAGTSRPSRPPRTSRPPSRACRRATPPPSSPPLSPAAVRDGGASASTPIGR